MLQLATLAAVGVSACGALLALCGAGDHAKACANGQRTARHLVTMATGWIAHVVFMVAALACSGQLS